MTESIPLAPAARLEPAHSASVPSLLSVPVLNRVELAVAALGTLLFIYLHVFFCQGVGALWRDEIDLLGVATLPTLGDVWSHMEFQSHPVLHVLVVRTWAGIFGADNDDALRVLGLLIGLGGVGALWLNARLLGVRWPLFSLVLLGCNPLFVRYSDSNRASGLGILLILLTLAAVWRVLAAPRPGRVLLAVVAGVLSVQTLYYNSVLLLAICAGAAVAAALERRWRTAALLLAIGLPAALSMTIYAGTIHRVHAWSFLLHYPVTVGWLWNRLCDVTGSPDPLGAWVWGTLFVGALGWAGWRGLHSRPAAEEGEEVAAAPAARVYRFACATLLVMTVGYGAFLRALNYYTQPWYYIAFLAVVAVCLDAVFGRALAASPGGRAARLALVLAMAALSFLPAHAALSARQTNVDLHAAQLNVKAAEGDLIVCNRWECAITLARYYHGKAAFVTLPPLDEHRYHCYDQIVQQMMTPDAAAPVLARMEATLRAGHRVWLSGPPTAPADDREPAAPPPAHLVDGRFAERIDYYHAWADQAGYLLREHAVSLAPVPVSDGRPVLSYERIPLTVFEGWH